MVVLKLGLNFSDDRLSKLDAILSHVDSLRKELRGKATYHSFISTVKMQGRSAWEFLGKFFTKIFNGCRDFVCMRPDKIGLAVANS